MPILKINENTPKERIVGYLDDKNHIFKKFVYKSRHLFRKLNAWGVDAIIFTDVIHPQNKIQVWDKEEDLVYEVDSAKFKRFGSYYHFKSKAGEDYRAQIFLPLRYWDTITKSDQKVRDDYLTYLS